MINVVNQNLVKSSAAGSYEDIKSGFIIDVVTLEVGINNDIQTLYPHIDTEYRKYIRHCKKKKTNPYKTVQFVPDEVWALSMVDTMENDRIVPCDDFRYFCNIFVHYTNISNTLLNGIELAQTVKEVFVYAKKFDTSITYILDHTTQNNDEIITILNELSAEYNVEVFVFVN